MRDVKNIWDSDTAQQLVDVLASISDASDMQNFLRDVMTEKEIIEVSARLEAARMLNNGETYTDITRTTKLSSRTVARISDWLKDGYKGYPVALRVISAHHEHTPPDRAA